jgi:hypothetical protein
MNFQPRTIKLIGTTQRDTAIAMLNNLPLGQEIEIVARKAVKARTTDQNSLMWSCGCLQCISEQLWVADTNGVKRLFDADTWHKYFKIEYLPDETAEPYIHELVKNPDSYRKWTVLPNGERELNGSTTDLTKYGMSIYMEKIYSYGAKNGVLFGVRG